MPWLEAKNDDNELLYFIRNIVFLSKHLHNIFLVIRTYEPK